MQDSDYALILAAGKGARMRSEKPKVLHTLLGESMLGLVLAAARPIFGDKIIVVRGHKAEMLRERFPDCHFVEQKEQLGTGHALMEALPELRRLGAAHATVINGDAPLVTTDDINNFLEGAANSALAFATITLPNPGAYGRVCRMDGEIAAIIEAKDYDIAIWGKPTGEVNAGMYRLDLAKIAPLLSKIGNNNKSGEYYLTDLIALALDAGLPVEGVPCGDNSSLLGVNSPRELIEAENILAARVADNLLKNGVTLRNPGQARVSPTANIEPGVEITAPCEIYGNTHIFAGAVIDSHCVISDSIIHGNAHIRNFCHLENAEIGENAIAGPYTRLRPQAKLCKNAHAGNFVELKKACLGEGAKANHLTYLGDSDIGPGANIGAGTITCNYDGVNKHKTSIGANAFIGSNTALVAPVSIGDNALVGAGSVITKNVPDGEMAIARGKQKNLPKRNL